jgi:chromosome segregation ATPase
MAMVAQREVVVQEREVGARLAEQKLHDAQYQHQVELSKHSAEMRAAEARLDQREKAVGSVQKDLALARATIKGLRDDVLKYETKLDRLRAEKGAANAALTEAQNTIKTLREALAMLGNPTLNDAPVGGVNLETQKA